MATGACGLEPARARLRLAMAQAQPDGQLELRRGAAGVCRANQRRLLPVRHHFLQSQTLGDRESGLAPVLQARMAEVLDARLDVAWQAFDSQQVAASQLELGGRIVPSLSHEVNVLTPHRCLRLSRGAGDTARRI
ncbi:MAG: hypothetical protein KIT60_20335 [Burkholderiaceae bacterium]|nr:hypothetical protein [Burkholderiaceae bacterium]